MLPCASTSNARRQGHVLGVDRIVVTDVRGRPRPGHLRSPGTRERAHRTRYLRAGPGTGTGSTTAASSYDGGALTGTTMFKRVLMRFLLPLLPTGGWPEPLLSAVASRRTAPEAWPIRSAAARWAHRHRSVRFGHDQEVATEG